MNREQAETLLAGLVADELDEPVRGELLAYLKTDAALAERLGDMRLAAGLLREGLEQASADVPVSLGEAQRGALLALIEKEPIGEAAAVATPRSGSGPLFTIRTAGAVAACAALGVGLAGMMLPELGEVRRTARRMMSLSEAPPAADYPEYAYDAAEDAAEGYIEVPQAELRDFSYSPSEPNGFGVSPADDLGLVGGTRLRYDKMVIVDGQQAGDLLSEASGTLVLGDDFSSYRTADAEQATVRGESLRGVSVTDERLAALDETRESHWQRPGVTTGNPVVAKPANAPPAPGDVNAFYSNERNAIVTRSNPPVVGLEGLSADAPQGVTTPSATGRFGALTLPETGIVPLDPIGGPIQADANTRFSTRYGDGQAAFDGDFGRSSLFDDARLDGPDTVGLSGQQGQQYGATLDQASEGKDWYDYLPDSRQHLDEAGKARDRTVLLRRIDMDGPPDEAVLPKPTEPASPGVDHSFALELPADGDGLLGQLADLQSQIEQAQITIDRNAAAMQIAGREQPGNGALLEAQSKQLEAQLAQLSELQAERSDLSQSLIDERSRNQRLSDNYLRLQEENKALVEQFENAPGFDLNAALSNTASGGDSDKRRDTDLLIQARANTAADKAKQAEAALRAGQLNAAVQLYEDATLLDPDNAANQDKLAEAKWKLKEQMRPLGVLDEVTVDRKVDRQAAIAEYEKAMIKATESLEKQDYLAANNAVIEARTVLARERSIFDSTEYNDRVERANQLQGLNQATQSRVEAQQLGQIEAQRSQVESRIANETAQRKTEEIQQLLRKARALQLEKRYDESLTELDAALFLDPDNAVIKGLRDMVRDTSVAVERFDLKRARDLEIASQTLLNIEATTPYEDILTYPGEWPELSAARLRGVENQPIEVPDAVLDPAPEPEPVPESELQQPRQARAAAPVNPWVLTEQDAQSTFALDTDTASYELARRMIREQAQLPPIGAVRMEEFVNRFDYQYPAGRDAHDTFAVHADAAPAPFAGTHGGEAVLLKVGVRGRVVARDQMKPAHYVFVIDASGSMSREDRLPLVQQSLGMLLGQLGEQDTVSLVIYETRPYLLLEHASASNPQAIMQAAATIQTGGSTNLTEGLKLGYQVAGKHFASGGVNRVILCSDGVANVGSDDAKQMLEAVEKYRKHGVTLMTVGVGVDGQTTGQAASGAERFNDGLMEQLANRGDGQYVYLGSAEDAQRQFVEDLAATRPTIAYDAKIQVAFDPSRVRRYRLIGYENRDIADRDFRNDAVDAGEVGSGQSATALYEIELWPTHRRRPAGGAVEDPGKLATVYVRYRDAGSNKVEETATAVPLDAVRDRTVSEDPRFYLAACAAEFAELLRESEHAAEGSLARLQRLAKEVAAALPLDRDAAELAELIGRAQGLPRAGQ